MSANAPAPINDPSHFKLSGNFKFITNNGQAVRLNIPAATPILVDKSIYQLVFNAHMHHQDPTPAKVDLPKFPQAPQGQVPPHSQQ
jgi:hypothetical protein